MVEIWKDIKGLEGRYQVSNQGRIKSVERIQKHHTGKMFLKKERIISIRIGTTFNGYNSVALILEGGQQKSYFHHRIIADAFIPNPENKPCVNHKNGIKTDNRIENLEWVTKSENSKHSFKTGLQSNKGEKHPQHKFTMADVINIRLRHSLGESSYKIYKDIGGSYTNIKDIIARRTWSHI